MSVRPLTRDEIPVATETLVAAFDDDPLFRWLMGEAPERRKKLLRWFHGSAVRECFAIGGAHTLEDGGPEAGFIGTMPPGIWPVPFFTTLGSVLVPSAPLTWRMMTAGLHIEHRIRSSHPKDKHLYVYVLGVHPSRKGTGLGSILMRHARQVARENACVTYLETANPVNLHFYRRHGLEVTREITSHKGPTIWTMTSKGDE